MGLVCGLHVPPVPCFLHARKSPVELKLDVSLLELGALFASHLCLCEIFAVWLALVEAHLAAPLVFLPPYFRVRPRALELSSLLEPLVPVPHEPALLRVPVILSLLQLHEHVLQLVHQPPVELSSRHLLVYPPPSFSVLV